MVYGARTSFHSARSIGLMPLLTASRYSVSPRCTTMLAPGFGVDALGADVVPGVRTTVLLHAASTTSASIATTAATGVRIRVVIFVRAVLESTWAPAPIMP